MPSELALGSPVNRLANQYFLGVLDEITVYSHCLSASDVQSIYKAGSAGKIPVCTAEPSGIVSWWQGEWDASDVFASNPGVIEGNVTFTPAEVGNAFTFSGKSDVRVPASQSLDVGTQSGFTIEAWVNPDDVSTPQPILEWNSGCFTGVSISIYDGYVVANVRNSELIDNPLWGRGIGSERVLKMGNSQT